MCLSEQKVCNTCRQALPMEAFYVHEANRDGRLGRCKECHKSQIRANRRRRSDYYREYDRKRGGRNDTSIYRNSMKMRGNNAVVRAVKSGKLIREPCFFCGSEERIHGHHYDYRKPLDVVWLCAGCHKLVHSYEKIIGWDNHSDEEPCTAT